MTGRVNSWAASVSLKFSLIKKISCENNLLFFWHFPFLFAKMIPRVAKKESWKERSFLRLKLKKSIIKQAKNKLSKLQFSLPKYRESSAIEPIIAARTTEGAAPTKQTNTMMEIILKITDVFLPKKKVPLAIRLVNMVMFIPDRAIICSVPVVTRSW